MKAVILAGGLGSRISEESHLRPKPMIEIGGKPILWHIMKIYAHHGINDFVVCLGYKGYAIKEYFSNYFLHNSDVTIDARANTTTFHNTHAEPWRVTLIDTGQDTLTGGRLKRVAGYLDPAEPFCFTYGDGVADIDIAASIAFHRRHGRRHVHRRRPLASAGYGAQFVAVHCCFGRPDRAVAGQRHPGAGGALGCRLPRPAQDRPVHGARSGLRHFTGRHGGRESRHMAAGWDDSAGGAVGCGATCWAPGDVPIGPN